MTNTIHDLLKPVSEAGFNDFSIINDANLTYIFLFSKAYKTDNSNISIDNGIISDYYIHSNSGYKKSKKLVSQLCDNGYNASLDTTTLVKPLLDKNAICKKGINTLTYHSSFGSFFSVELIKIIGSFGTFINSKSDKICDNCMSCCVSCPTNALENGVFNRQKCIRNWMDMPENTPFELIPYIGNRLLGCEECQKSCHLNNNISYSDNKNNILTNTNLESIAMGNKDLMQELAFTFGKNYAGNRIRAQALICLVSTKKYSKEDIFHFTKDRSSIVSSTALHLLDYFSYFN